MMALKIDGYKLIGFEIKFTLIVKVYGACLYALTTFASVFYPGNAVPYNFKFSLRYRSVLGSDFVVPILQILIVDFFPVHNLIVFKFLYSGYIAFIILGRGRMVIVCVMGSETLPEQSTIQ